GSDTTSRGETDQERTTENASTESTHDNSARVRDSGLVDGNGGSNAHVDRIDSLSDKSSAADTRADFKAHKAPVVGSSGYPQIPAGPQPANGVDVIVAGAATSKPFVDTVAGSAFITEVGWS